MPKIIRDFFIISLMIIAVYLMAKIIKYNKQYWPLEIKVRKVQLTEADSIYFQADTALIPLDYIGSIDFRLVNAEQRKDLFIQYLLPAIVITRERLLDDLHHVEFIEQRINQKIEISESDSTFLFGIKLKYETDSLDELKKRIFPHPVSLALTQAVLESGWGTSSIFRHGNNIFGMMSFSSDDPRSLIQFKEGEDDRYLRTYSSVFESVDHYYLTISTVSSYKKFRQKRWEGTASVELLRYMGSYHESDQYAEMARSIISSNDLLRYDNVFIAPRYLESKTIISYLMNY
ncbi:MAG: glucosaminidase domain-containing protein [Mariniphaga sp.]